MGFTEYPIHVDQLCVGVFVRLDTAEISLPFPSRSFKIDKQEQIDIIRASGLKHVICVLDKCDKLPIPLDEAQADSAKVEAGPRTPVSKELLGLKRETIERNKERKARFARFEKQYDQTMVSVNKVMRRISSKSGEAVDEAGELVRAMVDTFLGDADVVVGLMTNKPTDEKKHYHALNITVLSMMVGKDMGLDAEAMHILGMGGLFHDIGKGRVPIQQLKGGKATAMSSVLKSHYTSHPEQGARQALEMPGFPRQAVRIILEHHEAMDGSGFPKGLSGDAIMPYARIVHVVDAYENLLNDENGGATPHEALKLLFAMAKKAGTLDARIVSVFIRCLGVYPPGTLVQLSNGATGMVLATNPAKAARPTVLIYHADVPRKEALVVDLAVEDELEVSATIKADDLPREVYAYLSPVSQYNYYAESMSKGS